MMKFTTRLTALLTLLVMMFVLVPVTPLAVEASAASVDEFTAGVTLDYDALFNTEYTYVINPSWAATDLASGKSLSFVHRGKTYTETYNAARHFNDPYTAYKYHINRFPDGFNSEGESVIAITPVLILAPGLYKTEFRTWFNVIILGANAGIDPNNKAVTNANVTETTIKNGWAQNTALGTPSIIQWGVTSSRWNDNRHKKWLDAQGNPTINFVIDGVEWDFGGGAGSGSSLVNVQDKTENLPSTIDVQIQNINVKATGVAGTTYAAGAFFANTYEGNSVSRVGIKNVRMDGVAVGSMARRNASVVHIDGLYYANNAYRVMNNNSSGCYHIPKEFEYKITNSYFYKLTHNAPFYGPLYENSIPHHFTWTFTNNMFYECGSGSYGGIRFHTKMNHVDITKDATTGEITNEEHHILGDEHYELIFTHNSVVADRTVNTSDRWNFFNGNAGYQQAPFSIRVNENRFVGYRTIFMNTSNTPMEADFHRNYYKYKDFTTTFANTYYKGAASGGVRTAYANVDITDGTDPYTRWVDAYKAGISAGATNLDKYARENGGGGMYSDPFDYYKLSYYTAWDLKVLKSSNQTAAATNTETTYVDVYGTNFDDKITWMSVDHANKYIDIGIRSDATSITNPTVYMGSSTNGVRIYTHATLTSSTYLWSGDKSTFSAIASTSETTKLYCRYNSSTRYKIKLYIDSDTTPTFASGYTGPMSGAYLYAPAVSGMSNGSTYKALWEGKYYNFTVGTNAFATIDAIFSKAGTTSRPKIIIAPGTYSAITIKYPCLLYGYNYSQSPAVGEGIDDWQSGGGWNGATTTKVAGITLGAMSAGFDLDIKGIELTGAFTDTTRTVAGTVRFRNSVIDTTASTLFNVGNNSVKTAANSYDIACLRIDNMGKSGGKGIFFGGAVPSDVSVHTVWSRTPNLTTMYGTTWAASLVKSTDLRNSIRYCRFEGVTGSNTLFNDPYPTTTANAESANDNTIIELNSVFTNSYNGTLITAMAYGLDKGTASTYYGTKVRVNDNYFINESGAATLMQVNYSNCESPSKSFYNNRVVGFPKGFTKTNDNLTGSTGYIKATDCYFSEYDAAFDSAWTGTCPTGAVLCDDYFADFAMTTLVNAVGTYSFKDADELVVDYANYTATLTVDADTETVNFENYFDKGDCYVDSTYAVTGEKVKLDSIDLTDPVTAVRMKLENYNNSFVSRTWTVYIKRDIPVGCDISDITADAGTLIYDDLSGIYYLTLPEDTASANINVAVADVDAKWSLSYNGAAASNVTAEKDETKTYTVTVTNGAASMNYVLEVYRDGASGYEIDYDTILDDAYIIDADWASTTSGTVSYVFRGETITETYDPARHFASYDAAYEAHLATADIVNDTPVFLFTAGTYGMIFVRYRAIILGANAGINPNADFDASSMLPNATSVAANTAWNTANETIFTAPIRRDIRVNGSPSDLTYSTRLDAAEAAAGKKAELLLVVDGIKRTGADAIITSQDIDVPTGKGYRVNDIIIQNILTDGHSGSVNMTQETTYNYTTIELVNARILNYASSVLFSKYIDNIVFDKVYVDNATKNITLLASGGSLQARRDINYVFKNSVFRNSPTGKLLTWNTSSAFGEYTKGSIKFINNTLENVANSKWGIFVISSNIPGMSFDFIGNNIYEMDGFAITTLFEGNYKFFDYPYNFTLNHNRFIGNIASALPNLNGVTASTLAACDFDFNFNYYSKTYTNANDVAGAKLAYGSAPSAGCPDPADIANSRYYLDFAMKVLNGDLEVVGVDGLTSTTFDADTKTINVGFKSGTLADMNVAFVGANVGYKVYSDSACTTAVDPSTVTIPASGSVSYTYYLRGEVGAAKGSVYTLNVIATKEAGYFVTEFDDPANLIKNTAILLDTSLTASNGAVVTSKWCGTDYKFTFGTNAFKSIDDIYTYATNNSLDSIQVLIKGWTKGDLTLKHKGQYFTENYNTTPYLRNGVSEKAIEWDGETNWTENPAYETLSDSMPTVTNIIVTTAKDEVSLYGITFTGTVREARTSTGNFNFSLINCKKTGTDQYSDSTFLFDFGSDTNITATATRAANADNFLVKDFYLETVKSVVRLTSEPIPAHVTFDGVWNDGVASNLWDQRCFPKTQANDTSFTIKNSNLRNWYPNPNGANPLQGFLQFQPYNTSTVGTKTSKLIFDNNILYNYAGQIGGDGSYFAFRLANAQGYSDIIIKDNFVFNPDAPNSGVFHSTGIADVRKDGAVVVSGNTFIGFGSGNTQIAQSSNFVDEKAQVYRNFVTTKKTIAEAKTVIGGRTTNSGGLTGDDQGYWLDYDRTIYSDTVLPMYIDGVYLDEDTYVEDVYYYIGDGANRINYWSLISNPYGNTVEAFADESMLISRNLSSVFVPTAGLDLYLKITSPDNMSMPKFVTVHFVKQSSYFINNVYIGTEKVDDRYNMVSWRGTVTGTGDMAYVSGDFGGGTAEHFGVIYMNSANDLEAVKAALAGGLSNFDAAVASVNSTYSGTTLVHSVTDEATSWNEKTQSYSYRYNFRIKNGQRRATVMFAVYTDANGAKQIIFSELDARTAITNEQ